MSAATSLPRLSPRGVESLCPQCCKWRTWPEAFLGVRGLPVAMCDDCRRTYKGWGTKTPEEKAQLRAERLKVWNDAGWSRVRFIAKSSNAKLGPIPVTMTERGSCPDACSFKNNGCYAEQHQFMRYYWEKTSEDGLAWPAFLARVRALEPGRLWRHNESGDLPGLNDAIDTRALRQLADANRGRRGFTFTAKPMTNGANRRAVADAVRRGFVINLSAHSLEHADELAALGIAPVSVVLPEDWPDAPATTRAGRTVIVCPAQRVKGITCATCALCAKGDRQRIIGFRAHGSASGLVTSLVRKRAPAATRRMVAP